MNRMIAVILAGGLLALGCGSHSEQAARPTTPSETQSQYPSTPGISPSQPNAMPSETAPAPGTSGTEQPPPPPPPSTP